MTDGVDDQFAWLEDVEGSDALTWVRKMNAQTEGDLFADALFTDLRGQILEVLEADDRIPVPAQHGDSVLNFWTDRTNRRGLIRRTTWEQYRRADPEWEIVLDIDALGREEGESWVFKGSSVRRPDRRRMLVELSPGGSDTSVTREFDLVDRRFIPAEEGGFVRPLAKGSLTWIDDDMVYIANDFGPESLTASGYPRSIRRWERGTPLEGAPVVFEGDHSDVASGVTVSTLPGYGHHLFHRAIDFYTEQRWLLRNGELVEIDAPQHAQVAVRERWIVIELRNEWSVGGRTYRAGSLLTFAASDRWTCCSSRLPRRR